MNIVITGSSSGIGRELALRFSEIPENKIVAVARNEIALKSLSADAIHENIIVVPVDITSDRSSLKELKKRVKTEFRYIDLLVNCAGYLVKKPFSDYSVDEVTALVAVNFTAPAAVIKELLPLLKRGSHVVNIGSMGGVQGSMKFPGLSYYSAAKGALAVLTECLAAEYAEDGIIFNCLCPGAVETQMFREAFPGHKAPVSAAEMADFIAYFAVNGNKFFNGKILPVALSVP